jgi:hypothetical protein
MAHGYETVVTHSYWLVGPPRGSVSRIDSEGPLAESRINESIGGQFETRAWPVSNFELCLCFNPKSTELSNDFFPPICGNCVVGADDKGKLRGLTFEEAKAAFEAIIGKQITTSDFWT